MKYEKLNDLTINPFCSVTVTDMGHIQEVQYMDRKNDKATIIKIDKDRYYICSTGEIKEYEHIENRKGSINSLCQTFKRLRYLINANFKGNYNELHVVLTYAENMTDYKRLHKDVKKFIKRLRYAYKYISTIDYINVVEPQGRGAWHCHLLLRFNDLDKIFIENLWLADLWGFGFVTIKSLAKIDNIGAYLSAYLSDLDVTVEDDTIIGLDSLEVFEYCLSGGKLGAVVDKVCIDDKGKSVKKSVVKGARLILYPSGINIYRKSKGIFEPVRTMMPYFKFKKSVAGCKPHHTKGIRLSDDETGYTNKIIYEEYNSKRKGDIKR